MAKINVTFVSDYFLTRNPQGPECIEIPSHSGIDDVYVMPRWLAELARFELDHEHDDILANTDA